MIDSKTIGEAFRVFLHEQGRGATPLQAVTKAADVIERATRRNDAAAARFVKDNMPTPIDARARVLRDMAAHTLENLARHIERQPTDWICGVCDGGPGAKSACSCPPLTGAPT